MPVCYKKLFKLFIDKKIANAEIMTMAAFSANTITRLKKDYPFHF